ncbi:MAG: DUF3488 domain-containing protein [Alphaproteobacteria bacterium]|nr:MAG: DUF3488 domain-containing protein [Alphaproteobacteria bacterium]
MTRLETLLILIAYGAALIGLLPVLPFLDGATLAILGAALATGIVGDRRGKPLLGDRLATLLAIGITLFQLLRIDLGHFVPSMVNLLVLLLAVRLAGSKTGRHLLQIDGLALLTLAASTLLTLDKTFFLYLLLQVPVVAVGLVLLTFHDRAPGLRLDRFGWLRVLRWALVLPVGALVLMVFFYLILPRTEHPLWHFLLPAETAGAGLADEVRPGNYAALAGTGRIAFRAESDQRDPAELYWRVQTFDRTDGRRWRSSGLAPADRIERTGPASWLTYDLEPKPDARLPLLDVPLEVRGVRHHLQNDRTAILQRKTGKRGHYRARSCPTARLVLADLERQEHYLQRPAGIDPRLVALIADVQAEATRAGRIQALERRFEQLQLRYDDRDLPKTADPVATFLLETRRGYCEYFASSFALLLRLSGVPARLVGGYLGGDYNPLGGYYLVGEDRAHVWVEALLEDGRWQRIDPSLLATNAGSNWLAGRSRQPGLWRQLTDSLDHAWNSLVITYDLQRQLGALIELERRSHRSGPVSLWWLWWLALPLLGLGAWRWRDRLMRTPEQRLLHTYRRWLRRQGIDPERLDKEGLFGLAARIGHPLSDLVAERLGRALYAGRGLTKEESRNLRRLLRS